MASRKNLRRPLQHASQSASGMPFGNKIKDTHVASRRESSKASIAFRNSILSWCAGVSISQGLAGFQSVCDALLCFFLPAQGHESLALQIQNILFAYKLRRGQRATRENMPELACNVRIII